MLLLKIWTVNGSGAALKGRNMQIIRNCTNLLIQLECKWNVPEICWRNCHQQNENRIQLNLMGDVFPFCFIRYRFLKMTSLFALMPAGWKALFTPINFKGFQIILSAHKWKTDRNYRHSWRCFSIYANIPWLGLLNWKE